MKCLVTGGNGYIGSHLTKALLEKDHSVNVLTFDENNLEKLAKMGVGIYKGDIRDPYDVLTAAQGCEWVFHLASVVAPWASDSKVFYDVNVEGTRNLLSVCKYLGTKRVLVSSSCGVFGPSEQGTWIDETTKRRQPLTDHYEKSKKLQVDITRNFLSNSMDIVTVYPTRVFGPGNQCEGNSISKIMKGVLDGTWRIIPGHGRHIANYIYVKDVVRGMIQLMEEGKTGEGYILGGYNLTYNKLFEHFQKSAKYKKALLRIPAPLFRLMGWMAGTLSKFLHKKPSITLHLARKFTSNWLVSTQKLKQEIGFRPTPVETAIEETVRQLDISDKVYQA